MRSDFWHRVSELPLLAELANSRGRLDLWPPGADELTEIIRRPAANAGLCFEEDERRRMTLDAQIAADAATAPGALPLLSYTLKTLYARDVEQGGGSTLTWQTYRELGGLQGGGLRHDADNHFIVRWQGRRGAKGSFAVPNPASVSTPPPHENDRSSRVLLDDAHPPAA
jgi:hypothetical protein